MSQRNQQLPNGYWWEPCGLKLPAGPICEMPVICTETGSVYGSTIKWACGRCSSLRRHDLEAQIRELEKRATEEQRASEALPEAEELRRRGLGPECYYDDVFAAVPNAEARAKVLDAIQAIVVSDRVFADQLREPTSQETKPTCEVRDSCGDRCVLPAGHEWHESKPHLGMRTWLTGTRPPWSFERSDGTRLNRTAYVDLVDENLAWLDRQPRSLERDHIILTVIWSVAGLYEHPGPGDHEWRKSRGPQWQRCTRCLATRSISAGATWEYFVAHRGSSFTSPLCEPPEQRTTEKPRSDKALTGRVPWCEKHGPNQPGNYAHCLACGCEELNAALSQIDEMVDMHPSNDGSGNSCTAFDVDCNAKGVVARVRLALTHNALPFASGERGERVQLLTGEIGTIEASWTGRKPPRAGDCQECSVLLAHDDPAKTRTRRAFLSDLRKAPDQRVETAATEKKGAE